MASAKNCTFGISLTTVKLVATFYGNSKLRVVLLWPKPIIEPQNTFILVQPPEFIFTHFNMDETHMLQLTISCTPHADEVEGYICTMMMTIGQMPKSIVCQPPTTENRRQKAFDPFSCFSYCLSLGTCLLLLPIGILQLPPALCSYHR